MLADTFGRLVRFGITPGQASDITVAPDLLEGLQASAVLADKAYDGNNLRARIRSAIILARRPCWTSFPKPNAAGGSGL